MVTLTIKIDEFEGPLDLLLHLIKEKKLNILNLDLQIITEQYLSFLAAASISGATIDQMSEYLPVASYLLELQSKQLLPKPVDETIDSNYEAEVNRQKIISRILEYKKFKEISGYFLDQAVSRQKSLSKAVTDLKHYVIDQEHQSLEKNNVNQLSKAMMNIWEQLKKENRLKVNLNLDLISAEDRAQEIKNILKGDKHKWFALHELFPISALNLHYFIITFIAILDLAKHQTLEIKQDKHFSMIYVQYKRS